MFGELVPRSGGDPIPLLKKRLRIGRRDGNDIVLNFANVSGHHCLMEVEEGFWFIRDLRSRNGVKIHGKKIIEGVRRRLDPGTIVCIAKHEYEIVYEPTELDAYGTPPQDEQVDNFMNTGLLDRAGLKRKDKKK